MKLLKNLYFAICFVFLMALPAHAYIDPSVATAAVQIIAGIAVVVGTVVGKYLYIHPIALYFAFFCVCHSLHARPKNIVRHS
jgi:hypothetical protein